MRTAIQKALQSHLLSFLTHRWALPFLVVLIFLTLNSVLLLFAAFLRPSSGTGALEWQHEEGDHPGLSRLSSAAKWFENIAGRSFEDKLCSDSIDIVYTWVNGTDPRQVAALEATKLEYLTSINMTHLRKCNSTENPEVHNCVKDDATLNRYIDNEELRYSLRSVEKYAPWIRNIYLVTNGQIPYWLNLQRPRLYVVTHAQIYQNKSHLPVFSSPSIETQLHNIPGLSRRWIYLNDDVMFGNNIWPTDFYSEARGQRIYLSWPVPNCADNCPYNWLGDGFCDAACNTTECDFDSGDCKNVTSTAPRNPWWWSSGSTTTTEIDDIYCAKGCPDSWIGDKYCDRSCKEVACGLDGGDCGAASLYEALNGHTLSSNTTVVNFTISTFSVYLNLSNIIPLSDVIISASHDNNHLVRSASILQKPKILVFSFFRKLKEGVLNITVDIEVKYNTSSTEQTSPDYNVTLLLYVDTGDILVATPTNSSLGNSTLGNDTLSTNTTSSGNLTPTKKRRISVIDVLEKETSAQNTNSEASTTEITNISTPVSTNTTLLSNSTIGNSSTTNTTQSTTNTTLLSNSTIGNSSTSSNMPSPQPVPQPSIWGKTLSPTKKVLDNYGESLKHVNRLMTEKFGSESRRVPAHMPHALDNEIIKDLMATWPHEFEVTASNKLRSPKDMQYAFAYYYFLMNQRVPYDFDRVYDTILDSDKDGILSINEIRTLLITLHGSVMEQKDLYKYREDLLINCSISVLAKPAVPKFGSSFSFTHATPIASPRPIVPIGNQSLGLNETESAALSPNITSHDNITTNSTIIPKKRPYTPDEEFPIINKEYIQNCEAALKKIEMHYSKIRKNKFEIVDTEEVAFVMVGTNKTDVLRAIDGIRYKRQKFICLNDNMNHSDPHSVEVVKVLKDLYESILPTPSSFELPPNKTNRFLYIDEYTKAKEEIQVRKRIIYILLGVICLCFLSIIKSCINTDRSRWSS